MDLDRIILPFSLIAGRQCLLIFATWFWVFLMTLSIAPMHWVFFDSTRLFFDDWVKWTKWAICNESVWSTSLGFCFGYPLSFPPDRISVFIQSARSDIRLYTICEAGYPSLYNLPGRISVFIQSARPDDPPDPIPTFILSARANIRHYKNRLTSYLQLSDTMEPIFPVN